jgi:hypothetical protein
MSRTIGTASQQSWSPKKAPTQGPRDEYSYTTNMISNDPAKRFLIAGEEDGRIIKGLIQCEEKDIFFPHKINQVVYSLTLDHR